MCPILLPGRLTSLTPRTWGRVTLSGSLRKTSPILSCLHLGKSCFAYITQTPELHLILTSLRMDNFWWKHPDTFLTSTWSPSPALTTEMDHPPYLPRGPTILESLSQPLKAFHLRLVWFPWLESQKEKLVLINHLCILFYCCYVIVTCYGYIFSSKITNILQISHWLSVNDSLMYLHSI